MMAFVKISVTARVLIIHAEGERDCVCIEIKSTQEDV